MKNISKLNGYLIVLVFWLLITILFCSCGTIKDMTMSDHTMRTKCNWVNKNN